MNEEITPKKRKKINRNGWMRKFQVWCFDDLVPEFNGYCPMFWFTWLCIVILPLILVGKVTEPLWRLSFPLVRLIGGNFHRSRRKNRRPDKSLLIEFYKNVKETSFEDVKKRVYERSIDLYWDMFEPVFEWIAVTPNWESYVKPLYEKDLARKERKKMREERRMKFLVKLSNYAHYVIQPLVALVALWGLYWIWKFMWYIASMFSLTLMLLVLKYLFMVVAATVALSFVFRGIAWLIDRRDNSKTGVLSWILRGIGSLFGAFGDAICSAFDFLMETIVMIYKRECPLIEWSDETGPIESNQ